MFKNQPESDLLYKGLTHQSEQKEMERVFARLFQTDDGKRALYYLQDMTFNRAHGVNASDAQLRFSEGQRALIATLMRMIDRGKSGA